MKTQYFRKELNRIWYKLPHWTIVFPHSQCDSYLTQKAVILTHLLKNGSIWVMFCLSGQTKKKLLQNYTGRKSVIVYI